MVLKRIDPTSVAKVMGIGYLVMGLLLGVFFTGLSLVRSVAAPMATSTTAKLFGVGSIVIWPIFYGVLGVISGFISAWVYNWIASTVGGIKLEFEQ